jgi:hypothetical protein
MKRNWIELKHKSTTGAVKLFVSLIQVKNLVYFELPEVAVMISKTHWKL